MKRKMLAVIVTLSLLMMSIPLSVFAADNVSYIDESGNAQNCSSATDVTSSDTTWGASGSETWYVVEGTVNINGSVIINGNVNLILCDDSELNVSGMIRVNEPNSFSVYGQSKSNGKLTAGKGGNTDASIGSCRWYACGTIKICGGIISATSGREGAGIGNAASQSGGSLYIYNGTVTATGGSEASGIGGGGVDDAIGNPSSGMSIYIYGGHVTARGGASDIGGGMYAWNHGSLVGNIGHAIDAPRLYSSTNNFTGMVYNANNHAYTTYGNVVLDEDLNIDTSSTLNVRSNTSVKVPEGLTLTNGGTITNNGQILVDIRGSYSGNQPSTNNVKYQIGWDNNGDGTAESYDYISYGSNLESSTTPTKPSTAEYDYSFEGWAPIGSASIENTVSSSGIYHPIFTSNLRSYYVTVPTNEGYTVNYDGSQPEKYGTDITFTVSISSGYFKGDNFAVKVNGNEYTPDSNGTYTVKIQGNTDISVEGVVMDKTAPVFSGIENGKTYCSAVEATVRDDNLDTVTINGAKVTVENGKFTVNPANGEQTVVATDKAGNSVSYTINVNNGHTFINYVSNNDATCTKDGTKTAKCEYCDATDTITDTGSATGHNYGAPEWTWSEDGKTCSVTFTCQNDNSHKETPEVTVTSAVTTPATCTEMGVTTYTAAVEFNGQTYTDTKNVTDVPAIGHNYGAPEWTWSEDGKTCSVTFTCQNDNSHKETPEVTVTSAVTTPATCTEMGVTTYTAAVEFNGHTYTDTKNITDVPAIGHNYADGKCTVCGALDPTFKPVIIAGANGEWQKGTKDGLSFTSNAAFAHFMKVQVDGKDLDKANYNVKEGSTIVTLKASYLETLSVGKHTLAIVSETGTAETEFTINAAAIKDDSKISPATGSESNLAVFAALAGAGILAITVTLLSKKKKETA